MNSNYYITCFFFVYLVFGFASIAQADESLNSGLSGFTSSTYGPIERDCNHNRIVCIDGKRTIFAVKGPLTKNQAEQLCPSTPKQTTFKRNRLPANMLNPMIIVNTDSDIIEYNQQKNTIQKTANGTLPKFSFILCGTADLKPNSGQHNNADKPIPLDTFLSASFSADHIKNPPTYKEYKAINRKFSINDVALGDSLAYLMSLLPSSEVNYEIVGKHITGYDLNANNGDITGKFDKQERLYELTLSMKKEDTTFSATLTELVERYGKPVVKGGSKLEDDLDPLNKVTSGTYIWKLSASGYLTISINTTKNTHITVKMIDLNQSEKTLEYVNKIKKQA